MRLDSYKHYDREVFGYRYVQVSYEPTFTFHKTYLLFQLEDFTYVTHYSPWIHLINADVDEYINLFLMQERSLINDTTANSAKKTWNLFLFSIPNEKSTARLFLNNIFKVTSYCELTHFQATPQWLIYYVVSVFIQKEATNLFIYFSTIIYI